VVDFVKIKHFSSRFLALGLLRFVWFVDLIMPLLPTVVNRFNDEFYSLQNQAELK
jgi:hypothetical protein